MGSLGTKQLMVPVSKTSWLWSYLGDPFKLNMHKNITDSAHLGNFFKTKTINNHPFPASKAPSSGCIDITWLKLEAISQNVTIPHNMRAKGIPISYQASFKNSTIQLSGVLNKLDNQSRM